MHFSRWFRWKWHLRWIKTVSVYLILWIIFKILILKILYFPESDFSFRIHMLARAHTQLHTYAPENAHTYTQISTHTHTHTNTDTHAHERVRTHTHAHKYAGTHKCTHTHPRTRTNTQIRTQACMHTNTQARTHVHKRTHILTNTDARMHTHKHTRTHTIFCFLSGDKCSWTRLFLLTEDVDQSSTISTHVISNKHWSVLYYV